ncbi:MAG: magnesium transporter [Planctomycetaceae bacterium]
MTGAVLPLLLNRAGFDPALMSNPLIASIVDVLGVVIYYQIAKLMLGVAG